MLFLALALAFGDGEIVEDFESAALDGWERIVSDAHPPYNTVELVRDARTAKSGGQFLRMRTMGGSTGYRLSSRRGWPVDASRPYRLSIFTRLTGARRNVAAATLTWLNGEGERISDTRAATDAPPTGWTELTLDLARVPAGAVGVSLRLEFEGDDVRGECDFDRLVFGPVQRLDVRPAGRPTAVFSPEEYPRFTLSIAGAPAGTHGMTVVMKTAAGAEIRRSAVLTTPSNDVATVDFPPPMGGAHQLVASIDGSETRRSLMVLVPNPWPSTGEAPAEIPPALLQASLRGPLTGADGQPTSAWLAHRALQNVVEGAVPMADPGLFPAGVRVAAFRRKDSAALALWTDAGEVEIPVTLNEGAKLYPPLGAIRSLRPGERLRVGPKPIFLVGIDPLLLELRLTLGGGDLPLQLNPSTRTLRLHNPSRSQALRDVRVRLEDLPAGWRASPRTMTAATLAPDADLAEDFQFVLPASETERLQELRFEIAFTRNGREHAVRLSRLVRLTSVLSIDCVVANGPTSGSKRVTVRITNGSDRPMTLALRARLPQFPEQNELLRDLAPGTTSAPFSYVVKDVPLLDPLHLAVEIDVQEAVGARAAARKVVPLR